MEKQPNYVLICLLIASSPFILKVHFDPKCTPWIPGADLPCKIGYFAKYIYKGQFAQFWGSKKYFFNLVKKHVLTKISSSSHMNGSDQPLSTWKPLQSPCLRWTPSCSQDCSVASCWTTFWLSRTQLQLVGIQDCILCSKSAPCSA